MFSFSAQFDIPRLLHVSHDIRCKKPRGTIVLLHGIGNAGASWEEVIAKLPKDRRIISLDLLGFGESPKPSCASYNVRIQARSVAATLARLRVRTKVVLVGHSMGALIAIELAKRYPWVVRGLVLCSPPIYQTTQERDDKLLAAEHILTKLYKATANDATEKPDRYIQLAKLAKKTKLTSSAFQVDASTITPYITALRASILTQTAWQDITQLQIPIHLIYSEFDPFIVNKHMKTLAQQPRITAHKVLGLHEVTKVYITPIYRAVVAIYESQQSKRRVA